VTSVLADHLGSGDMNLATAVTAAFVALAVAFVMVAVRVRTSNARFAAGAGAVFAAATAARTIVERELLANALDVLTGPGGSNLQSEGIADLYDALTPVLLVGLVVACFATAVLARR
jgi:hypothetical protein